MSANNTTKVNVFRKKIRKISLQLQQDSQQFREQLDQERERKKLEKLDLEECRSIFLRNQVAAKGRRGALTHDQIQEQITELHESTSKGKASRKISAANRDEWELDEVKRIVEYQLCPKRRLSAPSRISRSISL